MSTRQSKHALPSVFRPGAEATRAEAQRLTKPLSPAARASGTDTSQRLGSRQSNHALVCVCVCVLTCTQRGKKFSLGAALLGTPAVRGYANPAQRVPDAWLLLFIEQHADSAVLSGLFTSCRAGKDLVLQAARKATLQLRVADRKPAGKWRTLLLRVVGRSPDSDWRRQLAAAGKALAVRGARPTRLMLGRLPDRSGKPPHSPPPPPPECLARLAMVAQRLHRVGAGITELVIDVWSTGWDMGPLVCDLAQACPNVRSLEIVCFDEYTRIALPPPAQWPQLTCIRLSYTSERRCIDAQAVWPQIAAYMHQLTTLVLPGRHWTGEGGCPWDLLFSQRPLTPHTNTPHATIPAPLTPTTTFPLTHLECVEWLDAELLGLLLKHTPHLEHLTVQDIFMDNMDPVCEGTVWGLKTLELKLYQHSDSPGLLCWDEFCYLLRVLPRPRTGRTRLRAEYDTYIEVSKVQVRQVACLSGVCLCCYEHRQRASTVALCT